MTFEELRAEVRRWSFMPGWQLIVEPLPDFDRFDLDGPYQAILRIVSSVPDAYDPTRTVLIMGTSISPPLHMMDERMAAEWVRRAVHHRMLHEADEWLIRDGERPFDPHREKVSVR